MVLVACSFRLRRSGDPAHLVAGSGCRRPHPCVSLRGLAGLLRHEPDSPGSSGYPTPPWRSTVPPNPSSSPGCSALGRRPLVWSPHVRRRRAAGWGPLVLPHPERARPATAGGLSERSCPPAVGDPPLRAGEPRGGHHGDQALGAVHLFAEGATRSRRRRRPGPGHPPAARPWRDAAPRSPWSRASASTPRNSSPSWSGRATGVSTRSSTVASWRCARIVDIFPSTADAPVRVDLFGDEIDRLTTFDVSDQRSIAPSVRGGVRLSGDAADRGDHRRAAELEATEPWGRAHWERLARGSPSTAWRRGCRGWSPKRPRHRPPRANAQVVLVEPRRVRDRAIELNDEEAAWPRHSPPRGGSHPPTGAHDRRRRGRSLALPASPAFDRLLRSSTAPVLSSSRARVAEHACGRDAGFEAGGG